MLSRLLIHDEPNVLAQQASYLMQMRHVAAPRVADDEARVLRAARWSYGAALLPQYLTKRQRPAASASLMPPPATDRYLYLAPHF